MKKNRTTSPAARARRKLMSAQKAYHVAVSTDSETAEDAHEAFEMAQMAWLKTQKTSKQIDAML